MLCAALVAIALLAGCGGGEPSEMAQSSAPLPQLSGLPLAEAERRLERARACWVFDGDGQIYCSARQSTGAENRALARKRVSAQDREPGTPLMPEDTVLLELEQG